MLLSSRLEVKLCCAAGRACYFPPPQFIVQGEENYNLCSVFFSKFCQISTFHAILYLILRLSKEEAEVRK